MKPCLIYIQKRTHRAGAQTCLARLLNQPIIKAYNPILVCEKESGWLWNTAKSLGISCIDLPFPSSRSLSARLFGNKKFAENLAKIIKRLRGGPFIVHANDHLEGLLGLALARELSAAKAIFLRSPGMKKNDYFKYRCNEYDFIASVGEQYQSEIQTWDKHNSIKLIHDGIEQSEFFPPIKWPTQMPKKILVIGSALAWKGWRDFIDALVLLEKHSDIPSIQFEFTGDLPDVDNNNLEIDRLHKHECVFIGRVENFAALLREHSLVINPSRQETFGMAAVETVAAGIPLLSSRSGVIDQILNSNFLFEIQNPTSLYEKLLYILSHWEKIQYPFEEFQDAVKANFLVNVAAEKLDEGYKNMIKYEK